MVSTLLCTSYLVSFSEQETLRTVCRFLFRAVGSIAEICLKEGKDHGCCNDVKLVRQYAKHTSQAAVIDQPGYTPSNPPKQ